MERVPQIVSVSDMRSRHLETFKKLANGPVIVANFNKPVAVIVSPDEWNDLVEALNDYEDLLVARERQIEAKANPSVMRPISQLRASLEGDGLLDG